MQQHLNGLRAASVACATLLALSVAADPVRVRILGEEVRLDPAAQMNRGVLEGAPAAFAGPLGCRFTSDAENRIILITSDGSRIVATPGSDQLVTSQGNRSLPTKVRVVDGRVVCALRPLLEAVGCAVRWDGQARRLDVDARIRDITVRADEAGTQVAILTSLPVKGTLEHLPAPERWYVDLTGAWITLDHEVSYVNLGSVSRVRWAQFATDPAVTRVVVDMKAPGEARWEPREDGRGGNLVVGRIEGDEPPVQRRLPKIIGLSAVQPSDDLTRLRVELSDPVDFTYDVLRQPPRVVIEFPEAALEAAVEPIPVAGPFVQTAEFEGEPGQAGASLVLQMRQLIQFEVRRTDDPPAAEIVFFHEPLSSQRIVIDPGHGDHDSGAVGRRLKEKDVNLDVARRVASQLREVGSQVVLTRESDIFIDLYDRPRMANEIGADLFVSIHCNAMPKRDTGWGTESYYYTPQSKCLGLILQSALVARLGRRDNGLRRARFVVIRESQMPAVLVELMYLNHREEESLLEKPEIRQASAEAICEGLRQYVEGTGTIAERGEMGR